MGTVSTGYVTFSNCVIPHHSGLLTIPNFFYRLAASPLRDSGTHLGPRDTGTHTRDSGTLFRDLGIITTPWDQGTPTRDLK